MMRRRAIALLWYARYAEEHQRLHELSRHAIERGNLLTAAFYQRYAALAFESMKFWREAYNHE